MTRALGRAGTGADTARNGSREGWGDMNAGEGTRYPVEPRRGVVTRGGRQAGRGGKQAGRGGRRAGRILLHEMEEGGAVVGRVAALEDELNVAAGGAVGGPAVAGGAVAGPAVAGGAVAGEVVAGGEQASQQPALQAAAPAAQGTSENGSVAGAGAAVESVGGGERGGERGEAGDGWKGDEGRMEGGGTDRGSAAAAAGTIKLDWTRPLTMKQRVESDQRKVDRGVCSGTVRYDNQYSKGHMAWIPLPGRYVLMDCHRNQLSNRVRCIRNYLTLSGYLNRTLVVPLHAADASTGGKTGSSSSTAPVADSHGNRLSYDRRVFFDVAHAQLCFGPTTVMTPLQVLHLQGDDGTLGTGAAGVPDAADWTSAAGGADAAGSATASALDGNTGSSGVTAAAAPAPTAPTRDAEAAGAAGGLLISQATGVDGSTLRDALRVDQVVCLTGPCYNQQGMGEPDHLPDLAHITFSPTLTWTYANLSASHPINSTDAAYIDSLLLPSSPSSPSSPAPSLASSYMVTFGDLGSTMMDASRSPQGEYMNGLDVPFFSLQGCNNRLAIQPHPAVLAAADAFVRSVVLGGRAREWEGASGDNSSDSSVVNSSTSSGSGSGSGSESGRYMAVHWRRGDMMSQYKKAGHVSAQQAGLCVAHKMQRSYNTTALFLATDASADEISELEQSIQSVIPGLQLFQLPQDFTAQAWADMLLPFHFEHLTTD
ncbi:unnamed protein product [Closterium sp. NIES-64]|nr:unnamed protein product [Closterium sp. NIES-64]